MLRRSLNRRLATAVEASAIGLMLCTWGAQTVLAQERAFKFEVTPFGAYRMGGQFEEENGDGEFELEESHASGILLNIAARVGGQWEMLYARQDTAIDTWGLPGDVPELGVDVEYWHFGGTYPFGSDEPRPFLAFTLGVSRFDPRPSELQSESYLSASIGGGLQLRSTERIGVRIEGRVYATFLDSDSDFFCGSILGAGICAVQLEGTMLTQWEARAGIVFRF